MLLSLSASAYLVQYCPRLLVPYLLIRRAWQEGIYIIDYWQHLCWPILIWRWTEKCCHLKGTVSRDGFGFWGHACSVLGLNRGRGQFLSFLGPPMIFEQKKGNFLRLMRVCVGFIMLAACTVLNPGLNPGFLASYWSAGSGHFFRYRPLLPIGWRIVQILRQRRRKTTNTAPTTLTAIQASSQSTLINAQLYFICQFSRNDKNKQLTLLSQCKLALTAIKNFCIIKSPEHLKNVKTSCVPWLGLVLLHFCQNFLNLSHEPFQELCQHINTRNRAAQLAQRSSSQLFQTLYFKVRTVTE